MSPSDEQFLAVLDIYFSRREQYRSPRSASSAHIG